MLADWTTQYDHIWSTKVENRIRLLTVRLEEIEHQAAVAGPCPAGDGDDPERGSGCVRGVGERSRVPGL